MSLCITPQSFEQAEAALKKVCCEEKMLFEKLLAKNLAQGGRVERAIELYLSVSPSINVAILDGEILNQTLNSQFLQTTLPQVISAIGQQFTHLEGSIAKLELLRYANRILAPNLMTPELLTKFMSYAETDTHSKMFIIHLVPQHAYVGEFDTLYETILSSDTKTRIKMLTELANFYSYKKKYEDR